VPATDYSNVSKRGGIVGSLTSSTVRNCFNTGAFYGNQYVGGIVGYAYGGELKLEAYILYCYNLGCVNGMAKQSDSTVTPASCIGSVAGWANPFTQVTSCYYTENTAISDDGAVQGGIGTEDCTVPSADRAGCVELRTHGQMQQQTTFAGYDFTSVWTMEGSSAYPYPELITPAMDGAPAVPSPVLLTEIVSPASVTGIPHGMKWEETFSSLTGIKDHLPATVTLKLSDGSTREVPVTWTCDDYVQYPDDKMKPYSYAAIGTLRLPAGVANPQNLPLTTGVAFTVDAFVLSVKSVNSTSASVLNGTAFADMALPETVRVRFNDDTEERLSVVWTAPDLSVYNPSLDTVQRFTVYGTVTLPEGVQDPLALAGTASVSVTVQEKKYYTLNSMYYEKTGTYENGTAVTDFGLPASVTLNCSSYGSIEMKVTWDTASCGYDPASKEKQVLAIKGSVNLPDYILDPNGLAGKIVFTATVKAMPYVTMVDTASSVTNVLNGTLLKDMELPETVYISLSTGYGKYASVEWDLDRSYDYDPQKKVSQGFYVYGTAILPEGVYNKTNIPLDTSCYVSVSGAASVYLESVNTPSPSKITVPNGTDLSTVELPTTTKIRLNTWVYKEVSIVWDLANCGYDPGKTSSQTLTIKGQIQLPDNIPNIADVSTEVRITVVVQSLTASGPYVRSSPSLSHTKYNIENGTELTADLLPSVWTVSISDVTGKYPSSSKFPITWNLESVPYDPTNPHMQHITVSGKIQLPDDVANPNNYSMNVTAHLWFDASTESGSNVAALTKPTNVTFESGIVSWTASEHAQGYEVTLYRVADEGLEVILTVNADETQYDFSSVLGMDSYMATVIAIGDGVHYSNSVAAYSKFYTPVPLISAVPPAITAQPASASYILGSQAAPLTVTAFSPEGVVSYRWYESPDGTTGMGMPIDNPSEDPSKYTPDVSTVGTRYYYVVVTCTNDAATGEKTADTVSEVAAVTVTNGTGYSVSGKVSSSGDGEVTVQLIQNGVVCYETKAPSNGTYLITGVAAGEYTLRVSKDKHVTRDYTVTVGKP